MPIQTLTIEADEMLIHAAEDIAAQKQTTLSDLVVKYLQTLTTPSTAKLPPLTRAASGLLKNLPDRPYREIVEEAINDKHGLP